MGLPRHIVMPPVAAGVAIGMVLGLVWTAPAATTAPAAVSARADQDDDNGGNGDNGDNGDNADNSEERAIERAERLLSEARVSSRRGTTAKGDRPEATMALVELFRSRPGLGFFDSIRAQNLLARPSQGDGDRMGDGFEERPRRICNKVACVHHVTRGADRATRAAAKRTLRVWRKVWRHQINYLGYAAPPSDGKRGGDGRFDVYLADLGTRGLFGYCAPERRVKGDRARASSYCVLDNDFSREQYGADPATSRRVTAAHEFFHAVQFGYDVQEDPWLMESTATWLEERFADDSDDNRRFLRHGSVRKPEVSLDRADLVGLADYGNWAFWEYLSGRHGDRIVRDVWQHAGARSGENLYSVQALEWALEQRGGLKRALRHYASANLTPARTYAEGESWPRPRIDRVRTLGPKQPRARVGLRIDHLAARHVRLVPAPALHGDRSRLRVRVDGPDARSTPAAMALIRFRDGSVERRVVELDGRGDGRLAVRFDPRSVRDLVVTLVNASTRYRCGRSLHFACGGVPLDERRRFRLAAKVD